MGYAVVFSGGGALGAWELGCYRAILLRHNNVQPEIVTGASAGALNAAGLCAGLDHISIKKHWIGLRPEKVFIPNYGAGSTIRALGKALGGLSALNAGKDFLTRRRSLFLTDPFEKTINAIFNGHGQAFATSKISLVISLTDIAERKKVYYYKLPAGAAPPALTGGAEWRPIPNLKTLQIALMGTTALPMLFPPYNNLFDGGVLNNQPILPADLLGAKLIYVFIPHPESPGPTNNLQEIGESVVSTWLSLSLEAQVKLTKLDNKISKARKTPLTTICIVRPQVDLTTTHGVGLLSFGENVEQLETSGFEDASTRLATFDTTNEGTWY